MKTKSEIISWLKSSDNIRVILVEIQGVLVQGSPTTLYLSNVPYTTSAADTPANTGYSSCITGGVNFSEGISLEGSPNIGFGDIEIDNLGGQRDTWLQYVWANKAITVYIGDARWPKNDFRTIFQGRISGISARGRDVINLILVDKLQVLNVPISEATLGGATENKDSLIPLTFGECFNVEALLVDPTMLEYQVNNGAIIDIIEVRDNGAPVPFTKFNSTGKFRLVQQAAGKVTASVQGVHGDSTNNIATIVQTLITTSGPTISRLTASDIDTANFSVFSAANTQPVGAYYSEKVNLLEAVQALANSVGASIVMNSEGKLRLVKLDLTGLAPLHYITNIDMVSSGIEVSDIPDVLGSIKVGYCKNWSATTADGLAGGLNISSIPIFEREWLTVTSSNQTTLNTYSISKEADQIDTLLLKSTDATSEASRRLALWGTPRMILNITCLSHMLLCEVGDPINIIHNRFGLSAGKTGLIINVSRDWTSGRVTLGVLV